MVLKNSFPRAILLLVLILLIPNEGFAQELTEVQHQNKGRLFIYWGWNRSWYQASDINFQGANYEFTLKNLVATDRPTKFDFETYFHPSKFTIPQFNFRFGYFIKEKYSLSLGTDHMKYVVQDKQLAKISGYINDSMTEYDGTYLDREIVIEEGLLLFEHTDGLNYINTELKRYDLLLDLNKVSINLTEGFGVGILLPKTNTSLLNKERYDEFHLAGFGLSGSLGLNTRFYKYFFIQSEFKVGFINMPDIRTSNSNLDSASQHFFFSQLNIVLGARLDLRRKGKVNN